MTAGHVLPWNVENAWMTFAPGFNDGSEPYGTANAILGYGYNVQPVSEFDMAICVLDQDIGEQCGWVAVVWNSSDQGYNQNPFTDFLGIAGYTSNTSAATNQQHVTDGSHYVITVPVENGRFKLLNFPVPEPAYSGAVMWTNFKDMDCCAGVMSGIDGTDPPSGLGFAAGPALGDLLTTVSIVLQR